MTSSCQCRPSTQPSSSTLVALVLCVTPEATVDGVLQSHLRDYTFNGLSQFFLFILSNHSDFEPWRDSPWELTYLTPFTFSQTCVCLMANLVLLNLTLFLTVHFHAVHGHAATHMRITHVYASLPFCHHHVVASCYCYMSITDGREERAKSPSK